MKPILIAVLIAGLIAPTFAVSQVEEPSIPKTESTPEAETSYALFTEAVVLQQQRRFAEAAEMLERIIERNEGDDEIVQDALNHLVYNHLDWNNGTADEVASRALRRYPELKADTYMIPESVNALYDRLRMLLFGSLTIRNPEGCDVFLDGEKVGQTPYFQPYIEVGEYELRVTRERKHDYLQALKIEPDGDHNFEEVPLPALKDLRYWATRIGLGSVAAGTIALLSSGSSNAPDEVDPLPGPPGLPE